MMSLKALAVVPQVLHILNNRFICEEIAGLAPVNLSTLVLPYPNFCFSLYVVCNEGVLSSYRSNNSPFISFAPEIGNIFMKI